MQEAHNDVVTHTFDAFSRGLSEGFLVFTCSLWKNDNLRLSCPSKSSNTQRHKTSVIYNILTWLSYKGDK